MYYLRSFRFSCLVVAIERAEVNNIEFLVIDCPTRVKKDIFDMLYPIIYLFQALCHCQMSRSNLDID